MKTASSLRLPVAAFIFAMMACVAVLGLFVQPEPAQKRDSSGRITLESDIPRQFAEWTVVPTAIGIVANPETQQILDRLYSQVLTRTYINGAGYQIMLSLAYGEDQRGGLTAHRPEVCYPSQGFELLSSQAAELSTPYGNIQGRRLLTRQGSRSEPLIYWLTVGERPIDGRIAQRMEEMRLLLTGQIPDGLLFRVSSIDADVERAYREQEKFIKDLLAALPDQMRKKVSGL